MNIYFSGIGGVGLGPLAEIALDAGYVIAGSDPKPSLMTEQLTKRGVAIGTDQSGAFLEQSHSRQAIDWFVYTSALPSDHPELVAAQRLGIKTSKRDGLLAHIIEDKDLKLIAIAGTHGKTSTTSLFVWVFQQLDIPVSYSVGTTLPFGPSGKFDPESKYFVYECDEYDRNFLQFHPWLAVIPSLSYDHPDIYPTQQSYYDAFDQFIGQSEECLMWQQDFDMKAIHGKKTRVHMIDKHNDTVRQKIDSIRLLGRHNRENAYLVLKDCIDGGLDEQKVLAAIESFPGADRRFEKLADGLYTDYAVHPNEISATIKLAKEINDTVVVVYQPHQNTRQHHVKDLYTKEVFDGASQVYWLPTYLTREDSTLAVLTPKELAHDIADVHFAELDDGLWETIERARSQGALVLMMGAGPIDAWVREKLAA